MSSQNSDGKIFDFTQFKTKKETESRLSGKRKPLYVSHLSGKVTGSPHLQGEAKAPDLGDRLSRIRQSLEKINQLMAELKKVSRGSAEPDR